MKPEDVIFNENEIREIRLSVTKKGFDKFVKIIGKNKECDFIGLSIVDIVQHSVGPIKITKIDIEWT